MEVVTMLEELVTREKPGGAPARQAGEPRSVVGRAVVLICHSGPEALDVGPCIAVAPSDEG
jgi:hypothetical protein